MNPSGMVLRRGVNLLGAITLLCAGACFAANAQGASPAGSGEKQSVGTKKGIEPWSEPLFAQFESEYGPQAAARIRRIHDTAIDSASRPVRERLEIANATINQLTWISDREMWGRDDYWATPLEIIAHAGGDCEDMAIAKYVMLKMMGVPSRNLYLGYARLKTRDEAHMILVWANDARSDVRVLDNFDPEVKSAKARMDLQVVYLNDVQGRVILIDDNGKTRRIKADLGPRKMEKLEELKKRIAETRKKYAEYNGGRPLFPDRK